MQVLIIKIEWFVIIVDFWQMWVSEDFIQQYGVVIYVWLQFVIDFMDLVVFVFFLVFLVSWEVLIWFGFYVVELCVFYVFMVGLDVFIGN